MILAFDIEADALLVDASRIWCVCVEDVTTGDKWSYREHEVEEARDHLEYADAVVTHNGVMFDCPVMDRLIPGGFNPKKVIDTQLISRLVWPCRIMSKIKEHSLEYWGRFLRFPKSEHTDWTQFSEAMLTYCARDVSLTTKVYHYQRPFLDGWSTAIGIEHRVAAIIAKQLENGININVKKAQELYDKTSLARDEVRDELQTCFDPRMLEMKKPAYYFTHIDDEQIQEPTKGQLVATLKDMGYRPSLFPIEAGPPTVKIIPFNPGSSLDIIDGFKSKYGWRPKVFTKDKKTGQPTKTPQVNGAVLKSLTYPEAELIIEYRINKSRATDALTWIDSVKPTTGRLHHSVITNGAFSGRMTHSDPNINVPKIVKKDGEIVLGRPGKFGFECRSCFEPRPGWWQVGADASGLELRVMAHWLAKYDGGEYADILLSGDIHEHNRQLAGLETRDQAKTFIYALLYGAGAAKIGTIVKGTKRDGELLKERFLANLTALADLKDDLESQVQTRGYIIGLDGRRVPSRAKHTILNTRFQGDGAIIMKIASCYRNRDITKALGPCNVGVWGDLAMIHDEWQSEAKKREHAETIGEISVVSLKLTAKFLKLRCPLDGEYKLGKSWADCH